jgi:methyl-accepting chemotaxis protein
MMSVLRTIRAKLFLAIGILAAVAFVVGGIGLWELRQIDQQMQFATGIVTQRLLIVNKLDQSILTLFRYQKNHILALDREGQRTWEAKIAEAEKEVNANLGTWREIASERGRLILVEVEKDLATFLEINKRIVELSTDNRDQKAATRISNNEARQAYDSLGEHLGAAQQLGQNAMDTEKANAAAAVKRARTLMLIVFLVGIGSGGLFAVVIVNGTVKGMLAVTERIRDVAEGEGDLTKRIPVTSKDELAELSTWFNTFMDKLHDIISQVAVGTEHIASATEEISSSATQVAQGADVQRDQTSQVATAMQEMASTVTQVSDSSHKAAENAMKASETARKGGKIVEDTVSTIRSLADSSQDTAQKVQELGKSSDQIGRIIGVIDDIADQTNLLALNAAIEAARAGDQGRGFAVVADEVRKLAERTTGATKEIAQMIQTIQKETANAVQAMESATKQVERSVTTTLEAGDSLQEIIRSADQVGEMITQIATAATQQSSATEQINGSVDKISKLVNESAVGAQQSAKACTDLSNLALDLQALVGKFRLGNSEQRSQKTRGGRGTARAYVQHAPANRGNGHSLLEQYESEVSTLVQ